MTITGEVSQYIGANIGVSFIPAALTCSVPTQML
jgi:hypothetical protein